MSSIDEIRDVRIKKLELLKQKGINPYPADSKRELTLKEAVEKFDELTARGEKWLAGRIMSIRGQGAIVFVTIADGTGSFQGLLKKENFKSESFELFSKTVDIGDFIELYGTFFTTDRGEKTLEAKEWRMLSKSLRPLPEKWHGITDVEERFRKRYLDTVMNPDVKDIFNKKGLFWNTIREYLLAKNFLEVDTPVLENTTGGADARPFITHHNALDIDVYLRISAGELWQKKLLVGGFPRTFEIGRIFRNEGMSPEHLQDYTQLEYYMAYADYEEGMCMTKELYCLIGEKVFGTTKFTIKGFDIDLKDEWQTYDFVEIIRKEYKQFDIDPLEWSGEGTDDPKILEKIITALRESDIAYDDGEMNIARGIDLLWKNIRKTIAGPGFLINVPVYLEPLAKRSRKNNATVERFQVILAGSEMGKGFSELNDPMDQLERFMKQQELRDAGDEEAQMADMEFVEALEYAMPPAFGFGLSERLFSFLIDKPVRDAQLFPLMRPKDDEGKPTKKETFVAVAIVNSGAGMERWQEMNTIAHLNAAFGARVGKKQLFTRDSVVSKDNQHIKLNIKNAIIIKTAPTSAGLQALAREAKSQNLEVDEFIREMIETTNDKKIAEITASKNLTEVEHLGVLVYGPKSHVEKLTEQFERYS